MPSVWEEIHNKEGFFEQLSLKAGLNRDDWKKCEIWYYTVDKFNE
ncbi:hypothetical protein GW932_01665 [archaeon]|nr:hypothetical protein [archaeon]